MRLTKNEHSNLVFDEGGRRLVVDPGGFTRSLADLTEVDAVVVTHEHADHWTAPQITGILAANPSARVFGPTGVVTALAEAGITAETVTDGDTVEVGAFTLRFAGTKHAEIHSSMPLVDNTGVLVNGTVFHPGDSYTVPDFPVQILAAPVGAPWLKIGEAIDYVLAVAPARAFPIHEATLSEVGFGMHTDRLRAATEQGGGEFFVLAAGESQEL